MSAVSDTVTPTDPTDVQLHDTMVSASETNGVDAGSDGTEDANQSDAAGYISIKDFAYDETNPLHYGYFEEEDEEGEESGNEEERHHNSVGGRSGRKPKRRNIIEMAGGFGEQSESDREYSSGYEDGDNSPNNFDESGRGKRQSILLSNDYIVNQRAVALYDFEPENDNELGLQAGDRIFISYRYGQGWLVAENQSRTKTGLVPEEFVSFIDENDYADGSSGAEGEFDDTARPYFLTQMVLQGIQTPSTNDGGEDQELKHHVGSDDQDQHGDSDDWEDIDGLETEVENKLHV